jgi:gliding motility-associated-like protein
MSSYRPILLFALLLGVFRLSAQNLVPNPSFEPVLVMGCDPFLSLDFNNAFTSWSTPTLGTPDLFSLVNPQSCWNSMPNSTYAGVIGLQGPQVPRSGNVMAGIRLYSIAGLNQREYLQVRLSSPLIPCRTYQLNYYVSLSDSIEFAGLDLNANFAVTPPTLGTDGVMALPNIGGATSVVTDILGWTKISVTFQATAAWEYLTIGNFQDDNSTTLLPNPLSSGRPGMYGAYYFVDDVSVTRVCPTIASLGPDQTVCLGDTIVLGLQSNICYDSLVWSTGETTPTIQVMDEAHYMVRIVQDTCILYDTIFVDVEHCPAEVKMPNVFSPNNDGINDVFKPMVAQHLRKGEIKIFDRWGRLLFITDNMDGGWDGRLGGVDCPEGVYYYTVHYQGKDLDFAQEAKSFLLIR